MHHEFESFYETAFKNGVEPTDNLNLFGCFTNPVVVPVRFLGASHVVSFHVASQTKGRT